jgi:hypothetical protein
MSAAKLERRLTSRVVAARQQASNTARDAEALITRRAGKEADVIVLVLGTDASPAKKARDWAARPANLLNVAVSRARRRLFIIGDHAEWRDAPNFSEPARVLPRHTWRSPVTGTPDTPG